MQECGVHDLALNIRDCVSLCISDETLKAVGSFYMVCVYSRGIKDATQMYNLPWTLHSSMDTGYRIIQTINKLPDNVIRKMHTHSIYGLTNYAKKYFISNYKTECNIENCYTCQCSMR